MLGTLRELATFFLRLGTTAFGGPAGHIAMMEDELVRRRKWLSRESFLDLLGASNAPVSAVSGIVSIKILYGFDTRAGLAFTPDLGLVINQWSAGMIDANADGVINSLDYQRLAAVRLAVVARSRQIEKLTPGHTDCTDTIPANAALPTVFANQEPANIASVPIQVTAAVAGDPVHWSCYHYRVFETIVPLRNSGWKP